MIQRFFPVIERSLSLFCPECKTTYTDEGLRICPDDGTTLYSVSDQPDLAGAVLDGRFRIDKIIGHGGMGTVYEAQQLSVGRQVAIKVLRQDLSNREIALERFFREAKTISGLTHPNIVRLIDFGQDRERDLLYLVMEYVRGADIADLINKGRMRIAFALEILYQVCGALTEPHSLGVIHRDLKPDNLLLVPVSDGSIQAKVLDFGISRALESNTQLTGSGMICGTPAYMAPEQAQNDPLDARADIYALGVILYEMVCGWPPFVGTSSLQIMLKHIAEDPRPLRELIPPATLPSEVEQLVYDLMEKDPNARPPDVQTVRKIIEGIRKKFGLEIPTNTVAGDLTFAEHILPKLPDGRGFASSPTEALRRETGLELWATRADSTDQPPAALTGSAYDTEAEPGLGPTQPLTPGGKMSVQLDIQGGSTRDGGQQAWTPGDQNAVRRIKSTNETEIDPFAKTSATPPPDIVRTPTSSGVSPAQPKSRSNFGLIALAFTLIALITIAGVFTATYINDSIAAGNKTTRIEVPVEVEKMVNVPIDPKQFDLVAAIALGQQHVQSSIAHATSTSKTKLANKTTKNKRKSETVPKAVKKVEKIEKVEKKSPKKKDDFEDEVGDLLRDDNE